MLTNYLKKCTRTFIKNRGMLHTERFYGVSEDIRTKWRRKLRDGGVESPDVSIKEIEKHVMKNKDLVPADREKSFELLCEERLVRKPLQYIIGEWDFRYLTLKMKQPVFIPRPETEGLIDLVKNDLSSNYSQENNLRILEVGCGSGAISLSLLHEVKNISCVAVDVLQEAVDLTKLNAKRLHLSDRIEVYCTSIDDFASSNVLQDELKFDLLVTNPPYIPKRDLENLQDEIKKFESHKALVAGEDGFDIVRYILSHSPNLLKSNSSIWLELSETQPCKMAEFVKDYPALTFIENFRDCFDRDRFCHLRYTKKN